MNAGESVRLNADCLLREWPRASGLPVGLGKRGMALACAGEAREGWVPVDYQDRVAWVAERYVEGERPYPSRLRRATVPRDCRPRLTENSTLCCFPGARCP